MEGNKKHKDRVFRKLFGYEKYKGNLLELYNALNDSNYTNPDDLEINTLDDVFYMNMKNDVSCIIDWNMVIYEHQSTWGYNMPLRGYRYSAELYNDYIVRAGVVRSRPTAGWSCWSLPCFPILSLCGRFCRWLWLGWPWRYRSRQERRKCGGGKGRPCGLWWPWAVGACGTCRTIRPGAWRHTRSSAACVAFRMWHFWRITAKSMRI